MLIRQCVSLLVSCVVRLCSTFGDVCQYNFTQATRRDTNRRINMLTYYSVFIVYNNRKKTYIKCIFYTTNLMTLSNIYMYPLELVCQLLYAKFNQSQKTFSPTQEREPFISKNICRKMHINKIFHSVIVIYWGKTVYS